jgi:hypothetical protein
LSAGLKTLRGEFAALVVLRCGFLSLQLIGGTCRSVGWTKPEPPPTTICLGCWDSEHHFDTSSDDHDDKPRLPAKANPVEPAGELVELISASHPSSSKTVWPARWMLPSTLSGSSVLAVGRECRLQPGREW